MDIMMRSSLILLILIATGVHCSVLQDSFVLSTENNDTDLTQKCAENLDTIALERVCESYCPSSTTSSVQEQEIINLSEWIDTWDETRNITDRNDEEEQNSETKQNWRNGSMSTAQLNRAILKYSVMTDCTFLIGPTEEKVHAHRLILARSSPVFEAIFTAQNTSHPVLKVPDDVPFTAFAQMLDFLYTGEACINNFDDACVLSKVASKFHLVDLAEYSRMFLWRNIYPENLWRTLQCAEKVKDAKLMDIAWELANVDMESALKSPKFSEISQDTLVALLSKTTLNVGSELQIVDASLRWAMAEAARRSLPPGPESLRTALGPALSQLRFLALAPNEFVNMQYTAKLLTYTESMAVIFNLNSPGITPMPDNLSSRTLPRKLKTYESDNYFDALGSRLSCGPPSDNFVDDVFNLYTLRKIEISDSQQHDYYDDYTLQINSPTLLGIQIPTQIECKGYKTYDEDFVVTIFQFLELEEVYVLSYSEPFQMRVACNTLLTVKFSEQVKLSTENYYIFKIILRKSGRYPRYWKSNKKGQPAARNLDGDRRQYFWEFPVENFIYSVITPTSRFNFDAITYNEQVNRIKFFYTVHAARIVN